MMIRLTENDYVRLTNHERMRAALDVLRDVMPEYSGIPQAEWVKVTGQLRAWVEAGTEALDLEESLDPPKDEP